MKPRGRRVLHVLVGAGIVLTLGACGTASELTDLGDRIQCGEVEETGKVDMKGTGLAGFCKDMPEGKTGLIFAFHSQDDRERFFSEVWDETGFSGAFVLLLGSDEAVAMDATIQEAADLHDRIGGTPLRGS
jgi:hypothetical protein